MQGFFQEVAPLTEASESAPFTELLHADEAALTQASDDCGRLRVMKYLPATLLLGAFTFSLAAENPKPAPAGDPFVKNPLDAPANNAAQQERATNLLIVFDSYSMSREDAAALLEAETHGAARYRRVQELAKAGKARLRTTTALVTKSGQRAVSEAIDEVRYPTNFVAAIPAQVPTATTWETRNVGDTFEVEPVAAPDGRICDLNLVPQHVSLANFADLAGAGDDPATTQPFFNAQKLTTSVSTDENTPYYLGTFTPPPAQGAPNNSGSPEVWLAFVHTSIQKLPLLDPNAAPKFKLPVAVDLEYSCYSLDQAEAHQILVPLPNLATAWEKVHALAADKKAKLEFITSIRTKSGQRTVVEEIHEVRTTAEYNPPSLRSKEFASSLHITFAGQENEGIPRGQTYPGHPTKIDSRNAGITAEAEPVIYPDGNTVDVNHVIQHVRYLGPLKVPGVGAHYLPQPLFQTSKVTTSQAMTSGIHTLVGTFNPPGADGVNDQADSGRIWLLFMRATVVEP